MLLKSFGRCVAGGMLLIGVVSGCATERAVVQFGYMVQPEKGMPRGMETITILPAKVRENTDPKWSDLCATTLNSLVRQSINRYGTELRIVDRQDTQVTFDEADLAAAGMSTRPGGSPGTLLAADGVILSNINVKIEKHVGKQTTISGLDLLGFGGHGFGGGRVNIDTREVDVVTRHMTVQTEFKLVDTANNESWDHYSPQPYSATDRTKSSFFFGSSQTEAALTPRDRIIAVLVERAAREFVSRLMPCRIDVSAEVESSTNGNCVQGVKWLRAEAFDEALTYFKMALAAKPGDHRAAFGAGLAAEATGQYDLALRYYRQACAGQENFDYRDARNRMKTYGHRAKPE